MHGHKLNLFIILQEFGEPIRRTKTFACPLVHVRIKKDYLFMTTR
jgi:hypothetical protein